MQRKITLDFSEKKYNFEIPNSPIKTPFVNIAFVLYYWITFEIVLFCLFSVKWSDVWIDYRCKLPIFWKGIQNLKAISNWIFLLFRRKGLLGERDELHFTVVKKIQFFRFRRRNRSLRNLCPAFGINGTSTGLSCHLSCIYFPSGLKAVAVGDVNLASCRLGDGAA